MGSLILCSKKKASQPYKIAGIQSRIYTIEELGYCLLNNLHVINQHFMSEQLCKWLEEELALFEMAEGLRKKLRSHASLEQFILYLLDQMAIYSEEEIAKVQHALVIFQEQSEVERQKYRADEFLKNGETELAISAYQEILSKPRDEMAGDQFYGKIYGCLGGIYGRRFLYREAAKMYGIGYKLCMDQSMLKAYLYACRNYMDANEYHLILLENKLYRILNQEIESQIAKIEEQEPAFLEEKTIELWKKSYLGGGRSGETSCKNVLHSETLSFRQK